MPELANKPTIKDLVDKFANAEQRDSLTLDEIQQLNTYYQGQYGSPTKLFDFTTDGGCRAEIAAKKNWHSLIDAYVKDYPWAMYCLIRYRKEYVKKLLTTCAQGAALAAKSVGSTDLTSDYDITIAADQGKDIIILRQFNDQVKADFKVQPGTVFDTNIYVKDYVGVVGNIKFDGVKEYQDADVKQDNNDWRMNPGDQDIAALIKQRRFSHNEEWNRYVDGLCAQLKNNADLQKLVRQQYNLADALFNLAVRDLLEAIEKRFRSGQVPNYPKIAGESAALQTAIDTNLGPIAMLYKRYEKEVPLATLNPVWQLASGMNAQTPAQQQSNQTTLRPKMTAFLEEVQQKNATLLNFIRAQFEDLVLEVSNALYANAMEKVRQIQMNPAKGNASEAKTVAKQQLGQAIFFASEAYHSEGAVLDIVMGSQEKDLEKKAATRKALLPIHLLESFNEQYGDFLKDIKHYMHQPNPSNGKMYYRCSKYLSRLFSVLDEMAKKDGCRSIATLPLENLLQVKDAKQFRQTIDDLLKIRKGQYTFQGDTAGLTSEKAAETLMAKLGVQKAQDLVDRITTFTQAFNAEARKCMGTNIYADGEGNISFIKAYNVLLQG